MLEFSAVDPELGGTFYLLEQAKTPAPSFLRQTHDCLQCHASGKTLDVPGHLVRSVYPEESGQPAFNAGTFSTSHESPLAGALGRLVRHRNPRQADPHGQRAGDRPRPPGKARHAGRGQRDGPVRQVRHVGLSLPRAATSWP